MNISYHQAYYIKNELNRLKLTKQPDNRYQVTTTSTVSPPATNRNSVLLPAQFKPDQYSRNLIYQQQHQQQQQRKQYNSQFILQKPDVKHHVTTGSTNSLSSIASSSSSSATASDTSLSSSQLNRHGGYTAVASMPDIIEQENLCELALKRHNIQQLNENFKKFLLKPYNYYLNDSIFKYQEDATSSNTIMANNINNCIKLNKKNELDDYDTDDSASFSRYAPTDDEDDDDDDDDHSVTTDEEDEHTLL